MMDKLVSVVIPTYKGSDVITRAIDSVLKQTYQNIEVIVVDDNAPDSPERSATEVKMQRYEGNESVVYLKHEVNKNGAAARNTGINYSHGEYIAFLDDDDWFLPEKINCQVEYLQQHPEFGACYCLAQRDGKPIKTTPYMGNVSRELLMLKSRMFTPSLFFRKVVLIALNGFDESFRRHQDYELLLRYFQTGNKIGCVEKVLVELSTGAANNIPTPEKMLEIKNSFLKSFDSVITLLDQTESGFKRKTYALHYGSVFCDYIVMKEYAKAINLASKYFFYSPYNFMFTISQKIFDFSYRRFKRIFKRDK